MARSSVATDDFSTDNFGTNYTNLNPTSGGMNASSGTCYADDIGAPGDAQAHRWDGAGTFSDDQYASIEVTGFSYQSSSYHMGVCVRASSDTGTGRDYYYFVVAADDHGPTFTTYLGKVVNGSNTTLHSAGVTWSEGDAIELEVEGTTLRGMKNGVAIGGSFTQTDSDLSTGKPGIIGGGASSVLRGDNWVGGSLESGTPITITVPTGPVW
jgi:hypothetical protein